MEAAPLEAASPLRLVDEEGKAGTARVALRLPYLDGLRAVAAAYVVLFHVMVGFSAPALSGKWQFLRRVFAYGHEAVAIFIVLSGYCLMLPVVRRRPRRLEAPFANFMRRRAIRILPPYFVALGLSIALIAGVAPLRVGPRGTIWDDSLPGLEFGTIASHLLLVHNWFPAWKVQINGPLWSVATEWQIYFAFPWLLLPVWRRRGPGAALAAAAVLAYAPLVLLPRAADAAVTWYLLLFALGMLAAWLGFSEEAPATRANTNVPWGFVCAGAWALCVVLSNAAASFWFRSKPLTDVLVGLATATLLVHLARCAANSQAKPGVLQRLLESRPLVGLGQFSYSLYLTHLPLVALLKLALAPLGWPPIVEAFALLAIATSASIAFAFAFYVVVERPCLAHRGPR
jgi:peptidoglycan/LPS O-acetylase OafA/YrhL